MSISSLSASSPLLTPPPAMINLAEMERREGYKEGYEKGAQDGFNECKADVKQIFKEAGVTSDPNHKRHFLDGVFA